MRCVLLIRKRVQFSSNPGLIAVRSPLLVITTGFINKHTNYQFDEKKQDWLVQDVRASTTS